MKSNYFFIIIMLIPFALALPPENITTCPYSLSLPNTQYNLLNNITTAGVTCLTFTAENVTLNCYGYTLSGTSTNTYGIYTDQLNSTIRDCNTYGYYYGFGLVGANSSTLINNTAKDASNHNFIITSSYNATFINNTAAHSTTAGINFYLINGGNNTINNFTSIKNGYGFGLENTSDNNITNSASLNSTVYGIRIISNSNKNLIEKCQISSPGAVTLFSIVSGGNNTIINNTLTINGSSTQPVFVFETPAANNSITFNNITSNRWIADNSIYANYFNTTSEGNIYYFLNGTPSWDVFNITTTSGTWATNGSSRPFNASNANPYFQGSASDWHPYTLTTLTIGNASMNFTNASIGHSFIVNASASNVNGSANITYWNITTTVGTCVNISNVSDGNILNVSFNCSSSLPATPTVVVSFKDVDNNIAIVSGSNKYPDSMPALNLAIVPSTIYLNTPNISCVPSAFIDDDGDTENTTARTFAWYINGTAIPNSNTSTITNSTYGGNDTVICEWNASAIVWLTSIAINNSTGIMVQNISVIFNASNITQILAQANKNITWNSQINSTSAGEFCILNNTVNGTLSIAILNNTGHTQANQGNNTLINFSCNASGSPFNITILSNGLFQYNETTSFGGLGGTHQTRLAIMGATVNFVSYNLSYDAGSSTNLRLWRCTGLTNASCGVGSVWTAQSYFLIGTSLEQYTDLTSNETVFIVTWDVSSSGSGGSSGGGTIYVPTPSINQTQLTVTGFFPEAEGFLIGISDLAGWLRDFLKTNIFGGIFLWMLILIITSSYTAFKIYKNQLDVLSTFSGIIALFVFAIFVGLKV